MFDQLRVCQESALDTASADRLEMVSGGRSNVPPGFLLALDVASIVSCRPHCEEVIRWNTRMTDEGRVYVFDEIEDARLFGIEREKAKNIAHAAQREASFLAWWRGLAANRVIKPCGRIKPALARARAHNSLRHLVMERGAKNGHRLGLEVTLAVVASEYGLVIATLDVDLFKYIHRYCPLPGLYDPAADEMHLMPVRS